MTNMNEEYKLVPIVQLLANPEIFKDISVFLKISEKIVKLNFPDDAFKYILEKLQDKGVSQVYLTQEEFNQVLILLNSSELATLPEAKQVEVNQAAVNITRDFIKQFGITSEAIDVMNTANANIQAILASSPGLNAFVKRFKKNCSDEFLKLNLTNYLLSLVLGKFSWNSPLILQKAMLANYLCDIHLDKADFEVIKKCASNDLSLPQHIFDHPKKMSEQLKSRRDVVPSEVITIVEQHHERPDGKGYPYGLTASRFNQLSAIFIVCHEYIERLEECHFDYSQHARIAQELQSIYFGGPFDKAMDALVAVVES